MACRTARPKRELVRLVRTPAGEIELDRSGRLPGRGAYLCADGACWRAAAAKGTLSRALGVPLPPAIRAILEAGPDAMTNDTPMTMQMATGGDKRGEE